MIIRLEWGAYDLHMVRMMLLPPNVSCFIKLQDGLTIPLMAYPGYPGNEAIK